MFRISNPFEFEIEDQVDFASDELDDRYWDLSVPKSDRPYQNNAVVSVWRAWDEGFKAPLLVAPTASGKTVMSGIVFQEAVFNRGERVAFVVDRLLLLEQARITFERMGLRCGSIIADEPTDLRAPVQMISKDTLFARFASADGNRLVENHGLGHFDRICYDECHRSPNRSHSFLRRVFPDAKVLGLTATPILPSGKMIGPPHFDKMIVAAKPSELLEQGYILDGECYAPDDLNFDDCENATKGADYNKLKLVAKLTKDNLVGSTIRHWKELADNKLTLVFCVNRKHATWLCDRWNAARIPSAYMGCETPKEDRKRIFAAFKRREILAIHSSDLLTEGVDLPWVEVIQVVKPTKSLRLWLQCLGRGGRKHTFEDGRVKEKFVLIDHAGCCKAHCMPNADIEWSLGRWTPEQLLKKAKERGDVPQTKACPKCFRMMPVGRTSCPNCGHVFREVVTPQQIENQPGKLVKVKEKKQYDRTPEESKKFTRSQQRGAWIRAVRYCQKQGLSWGVAINIFKNSTDYFPWDQEVAGICDELPSKEKYKDKISSEVRI